LFVKNYIPRRRKTNKKKKKKKREEQRLKVPDDSEKDIAEYESTNIYNN